MGTTKLLLLDSLLQERWGNLPVSGLLGSTSRTGETRYGLTRITRRPIWGQGGRPIPSEEPLTPRGSSWRRLEWRPSSLTLPLGSVSVYNSSKTERKSLPSSLTTVVSTSWRRTTRFWSLDSDVRVTLWEIFPESGSRSARLRMCLSMLSSEERRRGHALR